MHYPTRYHEAHLSRAVLLPTGTHGLTVTLVTLMVDTDGTAVDWCGRVCGLQLRGDAKQLIPLQSIRLQFRRPRRGTRPRGDNQDCWENPQ